MTDLERAIAFACEAHAGQVDKQGEPYILHPLRVMLAVAPVARRVAVLHDVAEDTDRAVDVVARKCSLNDVEADALVLLTRAKGLLTYTTYIEVIGDQRGFAADMAREVKVADLRDNLGRWVPELGEDLKARYTRALARLTEGETNG